MRIVVCALFVVLCALAGTGPVLGDATFTATLSTDRTTLTFTAGEANAGVRMTVDGPGYWHLDTTFAAAVTPTFAVTDAEGTARPDGLYSVELVAERILPEEVRAKIQAAREIGDEQTVREHMERVQISMEHRAHHQFFRILDGKFVDFTQAEPEPEQTEAATPPATARWRRFSRDPVATWARHAGDRPAPSRLHQTVAGQLPDAPVFAWRRAGDAWPAWNPDVLLVNQVFNEDVVIHNSLCVGRDCADAETFAYDTIRLKENNVRLDFEDTSSSSSYPTHDWLIQANDPANGGGSYLKFTDSNSGTDPFVVEAGAQTNSLYVDDSGDVGINTANPQLELHLVDPDTAAIRLEQTGGGYGTWVWDVAGNEGNFFVRSVSNSSALPFKIKPMAPTNSLVVGNNGSIGFGTDAPGAALHVSKAGTANLRLQDSQTPQNWDVLVDPDGLSIEKVGGDRSLHIDGVDGDINIIGEITIGTDHVIDDPIGQLEIGTTVGAAVTLSTLDGSGTRTQSWGMVGASDGWGIVNETTAAEPLMIEQTAPSGALNVNATKVETGLDLEVAAGKGLYLGGATTANKVDHYEIGIWTPAFTGSGGGTPTYAANGQRGTYQRIGNWVTLQGRVQLTALAGFSGTAQIGGLPFTPLSVANFLDTGSVGQFTGWTGTYAGPPMAFIDDSGANVKIQYSKFAPPGGMVDIAPGATFSLAFTISYEI